MNIFRNIYSWLNPVYGTNLYEYLKGNDCDGVFIGPNHFQTIGLIVIGVSLLTAIVYYRIINHPRFNHWWHWLIFLLLAGIISLFTGFGYTYSKLNDGAIPPCFTHSEIQTTQDGSIYGVNGSEILSNSNCWQFGFANAVVTIAFFIIFSFIFKWWSRNCKHTPCF
jgi:hypothetical protein